jgi:hypothetical protein
MSDVVPVSTGVPPARRVGFGGVKPQTQLGRWGIVVAIVAVVFTFSLPLVTSAFRETYGITDSWVMPVVGVIALDAAAIVNLLAIVWKKERSLTSLIVTAVVGFMGAFFTLFVVGEGLAGV